MTVTANLTNITLAESGDAGSWDDLGGGQGSGQDTGLPIQGTETRSRRVDNAIRGFGFDNTTGIDISGSGVHLGFWANVLQPAQIGATQGLQFSISDSGTGAQSGNWDGHNYVAANYPAEGGWQRVWIDPTRTRDAGSGTLSLTGVQNYGCEFDVGDVGGNAPNCHLDRIDYSSAGLSITAGSIGTPTTFADAVSVDGTNAYGIINSDFINGPVLIGGAATVFRDENFAIKAGNQPLATSDWVRIDWDASNGSEDILIAFGFLDGVHFTFAGTSATQADLGGLILVAAPLAITMTAAWSWGGSLINSPELTQGGATLDGLIVDGGTDTTGITRSSGGTYAGGEVKNCDRGMDVTALITGPTNARECTIDGVIFTSNTMDITLSDANDVTVNITNGGSASTVENTGAGNASISNPKTVEVTAEDEDGNALEGASVYLITTGAVEVLNGVTNASGVLSGTYNGALPADIDTAVSAVRSSSSATPYEDFTLGGQITTSGYFQTAIMRED